MTRCVITDSRLSESTQIYRTSATLDSDFEILTHPFSKKDLDHLLKFIQQSRAGEWVIALSCPKDMGKPILAYLKIIKTINAQMHSESPDITFIIPCRSRAAPGQWRHMDRCYQQLETVCKGNGHRLLRIEVLAPGRKLKLQDRILSSRGANVAAGMSSMSISHASATLGHDLGQDTQHLDKIRTTKA